MAYELNIEALVDQCLEFRERCAEIADDPGMVAIIEEFEEKLKRVIVIDAAWILALSELSGVQDRLFARAKLAKGGWKES